MSEVQLEVMEEVLDELFLKARGELGIELVLFDHHVVVVEKRLLNKPCHLLV